MREASLENRFANKRHGHTFSKGSSITYSSWQSMKTRVKLRKRYESIGMCKEWESFESFLSDMGERPGKEYSLGRIDNNQGYHPHNCRWETIDQQAWNKKDTVRINVENQTLLIKDIASSLGANRETIRSRIRMGWDVEKIVSTPIRKRTTSQT